MVRSLPVLVMAEAEAHIRRHEPGGQSCIVVGIVVGVGLIALLIVVGLFMWYCSLSMIPGVSENGRTVFTAFR